MTLLTMQAQIELLKSWAPLILKKGEEASPLDLKMILFLRASLAPYERDPRIFFQLLRADRACEKHCTTLLYLTPEEALEVVSSIGGTLDPLSWYGVHEWELSLEVLENWTLQVNDAVTNSLRDVRPAEILRAFLELEKFKGREYVNTFFLDEKSLWRKWLDSDDRTLLASFIENNRLHLPTVEQDSNVSTQ